MLKNIARTILLAMTIVSISLPTASHALSYNKISQVYFFGDSLTDSGFNDLWPTVANPPTIPALPAGKAPTFTTYGGYTWAQYVARDIKGVVLPIYPGPTPADTISNNTIYPVPGFATATLTGTNYAAGGSTTNSIGVGEVWAPSLHQQVAKYLSTAGQILDPNAVYFIWSGANDLLAVLESAPPVPTELQLLTAMNNAAINIANEVKLLASRGAKRIVVLSLPNIGYTPLINGLSVSMNQPTLPADMKTVTFTFNSMLNTQLGKIIAKYNNTKILYIDVYTLLDNVIIATKQGKSYAVAGQSFQFANYADPACGSAPSAIYCPNGAPDNYIFADALHPSGMAHRLLSLQVESEIQQWK